MPFILVSFVRKTMDTQLDIEIIFRQERKRWLREEAPRRSFRDVVAGSVPYWIVIVALVLFGLSAPHTAHIFNMLTPQWGYIAPVGVEFGLLYAAFRRRLVKAEGQSLPWTLRALELLLFLTAILVNGAGAFASVVQATGLVDLSFSAITEGFGGLPATSQAALLMAGLSALIIPIGTLVAGDGLADLTLEKREHTDFREQRWKEVELQVVYRAVYVRYLQQGLPDKEAKKRAISEVRSYLDSAQASPVHLLSAQSGQGGQSEHPANGQSGSVKENVHIYLDTHPELLQKSVNNVLRELHTAGFEAGRTTVAEALKERKEAQ
jgi:hypothetical protein